MLLTVSDKSEKNHKLDILPLSTNQHQLKIPTLLEKYLHHFLNSIDPNFSSPLQLKAFLTFAFIALRVLSTQSDPYQALMTMDTKHIKKTIESESEAQTGLETLELQFLTYG